jgi:hypothetical protein
VLDQLAIDADLTDTESWHGFLRGTVARGAD